MIEKYAISAAIEEIPKSYPFVLRGDFANSARKASAAGFDKIELHLTDPKKIDGHKLLEIAKDHGLSISAIGTGMEHTKNRLSLIDDDPAERDKAIQRMYEHIDLAEVFGCPVIIGVIRSNIPDFARYDEYERRLTRSLGKLSIYAEKKQVNLLLEAITRYINNYLNTVNETYDYIKKTGLHNVLLHIDTHSMNIEDVDMEESIQYAADRLGYVHFSDSNRRRPGAGHIDFEKVLNALEKTNYKGNIGIECLPIPDSDTCMHECITYLKSIE